MKEWIQEIERWGADVIFGRAKGFRASLMRFLMLALSGIFRIIIAIRLWRFRHGWQPQKHLGCQVIAIGNITVGGTGKTPVVELLARTLRDRGRRVAILSRGYKSQRLTHAQKWLSSSGRQVPSERMPKVVSTGNAVLLDSKYAGDEPFMLAKNLDGVAVLVDKNRVKSARFGLEQFAIDTILLDDGMQYLKLAHSMDIVLVDANSPFGTGALLPRGTLREPPKSLRRASYILITKCGKQNQSALIERIRRSNRIAEIIECDHGPIYLENVFSGERLPLDSLTNKFVGAISAIAVPEAFEGTLEKLGAKVVICRRFSDHYRFSKREVEKFMQRCVERDMNMILTTEKDAVRFPRPASIDVPIYFLRIEVQILRGHDAWENLLDRICQPSAPRQQVMRNRHAYPA